MFFGDGWWVIFPIVGLVCMLLMMSRMFGFWGRGLKRGPGMGPMGMMGNDREQDGKRDDSALEVLRRRYARRTHRRGIRCEAPQTRGCAEMRRLLMLAALAAGVSVVIREIAGRAALPERCAEMCDRFLANMPGSFPPNRIMADLDALKEQNVRILKVLEEREEGEGPQE